MTMGTITIHVAPGVEARAAAEKLFESSSPATASIPVGMGTG
jgi:hypothetical protein